MEQLERARQEVLNYLEENLDRLSKDQEKLVEEVIAYLSAKNYVIDRKLLKMIYEIIEENYRFIETFLKNLTLEKLPLPGEVDNNAFRQKLLDRLFNFLYPDGLNLSERLWKRKEEAKKEFFQVLKQQLHLRRSAIQTAYKIQYHMERKLGRKFVKLTKEEIKQIVRLQFNRIRKMLEKQNIDIEITEKAVEYIANEGFDPQFGARPIKRMIQKEVLNELAKALIAGEVTSNDKITIDFDGNKIVFTQEKINA